jgi:membrane protein YdbS with pleckstrin-like domain
MYEYDFQDITNSDERILVSFKPSVLINFIRSFYGVFLSLFGMPFLFGGLMVWSIPFFGAEESTNFESLMLLILIPFGAVFVLVGGGLVIAPIVNILNTPRKIRKTVYAISNERIITRTGNIGVDYKSIPYFSIEAIDVNVGFFDKIFGTGSLIIKGMETEKSVNITELISLAGIKNPLAQSQNIMRELQFSRPERNYDF